MTLLALQVLGQAVVELPARAASAAPWAAADADFEAEVSCAGVLVGRLTGSVAVRWRAAP